MVRSKSGIKSPVEGKVVEIPLFIGFHTSKVSLQVEISIHPEGSPIYAGERLEIRGTAGILEYHLGHSAAAAELVVGKCRKFWRLEVIL